MNKRVLVCGAGGFIGGHLVKRLKREGCWVRGVDLKRPEFGPSPADEFVIGDLRDPAVVAAVLDQPFDGLYQLAADMGGAGYLFTGDNDADVMHNSVLINLNVLDRCRRAKVRNIFYSSSACVYADREPGGSEGIRCAEDSVYPAAPDSEYGWEKLFAERMYFAFQRNHGLRVHVARFHNIFGPEGSWNNGREKAPAAICRKVAEAQDGGTIEIWGDGAQERSFLYIDECIEAVRRFMDSDFGGPVNIGSEEAISINGLARLAMEIAGKKLAIRNIPGPVGVRARCSDNRLIGEKLGWAPSQPLRAGLERTYAWIEAQVRAVAAPVSACPPAPAGGTSGPAARRARARTSR